jgi:hypothetical protein
VSSNGPAVLSISWRNVALISTTIAIAAMSCLAIVSTIKGADTLSVVALALAVIAFVVQLIVFVVQAVAANDQQRTAQAVYAETLGVLKLIEEKTEGTQRTIKSMNDTMLVRLLDQALPEVAKKGLDATSPAFAEELAGSVARALSNDEYVATLFPPVDSNKERNRRIHKEMQTFPTGQDFDTAYQTLSKLVLTAVMALERLGRDEISSRADGSIVTGQVPDGVVS